MPARRESTISDDEAKRRGALLLELRKKLEIPQALIPELSNGLLSRTDVVNAENGKTKWRAEKLWSGFEAAYNMRRDRLEDFFAKRLSVNDAFTMAWPKIKKVVESSEGSRAHEREIDAVAREGLATAGLSEDEIADAILPALRAAVRQDGLTIDRRELAQKALKFRAIIVKSEREQVAKVESARSTSGGASALASHKSESDRPKRRR